MKFSELLGEPQPEQDPELEHERDLERERVFADEAEPISVFAPVPLAPPPAAPAVVYPSTPPEPVEPRSGLAEINVRQEAATPVDDVPAGDPLAHLEAVVDDLLPSTRGRR